MNKPYQPAPTGEPEAQNPPSGGSSVKPADCVCPKCGSSKWRFKEAVPLVLQLPAHIETEEQLESWIEDLKQAYMKLLPDPTFVYNGEIEIDSSKVCDDCGYEESADE